MKFSSNLFFFICSLYLSFIISFVAIKAQQHDDKKVYPKHHPLSATNEKDALKIATEYDELTQKKYTRDIPETKLFHVVMFWTEFFGNRSTVSLIQVDKTNCYHIFTSNFEPSTTTPIPVLCPVELRVEKKK